MLTPSPPRPPPGQPNGIRPKAKAKTPREDLPAKIKDIEKIVSKDGVLFAKIRGINKSILRLDRRVRDLENEGHSRRGKESDAAAALRLMEGADVEGNDVITMPTEEPDVEGNDVITMPTEQSYLDYGPHRYPDGVRDKTSFQYTDTWLEETAKAKAKKSKKKKSKKRKKSTKRKKKQTKRKKR